MNDLYDNDLIEGLNGIQNDTFDIHGIEIEYNSEGKAIKEIFPNGDEFRYDSRGNMIYHKMSNDLVFEAAYNDKNVMIWFKNQFSCEFKYDEDSGKCIWKKENGNESELINGKWELIVGYERYPMSSVIKVFKTKYGHVFKYNEQGKLIYRKEPNGEEFKYHPDNDEKPIWHKDINGYQDFFDEKTFLKTKQIFSDGSSYEFDDKGNIIKETFSNGQFIEYKHNEDGYVIWKREYGKDEFVFDNDVNRWIEVDESGN
jgi:hypothetical protein